MSSLKEGFGGSFFLLSTENVFNDHSKADAGNVKLVNGKLVVLVNVPLRKSLVLYGAY
jgi:hypothetical protein